MCVTQLIASEAAWVLPASEGCLDFASLPLLCKGGSQAPLPQCENFTPDVATEHSPPRSPLHPSLTSAPTALACHPHGGLTHRVAEGVRWVGDREYWTFTVTRKPLASQGYMGVLSQGGKQRYSVHDIISPTCQENQSREVM